MPAMDVNTTENCAVSSLFGHNTGPVISSHVCSLHRQTGRLYCTSNALCFYSNMFGFERKILVRISSLQYAALKRTTSILIRSKFFKSSSGRIPSQERLNEKDEENCWVEEEHTFRSFEDRQSVLEIILDAYSKLMGIPLATEDGGTRSRLPSAEEEGDEIFTTPLRKRVVQKSALRGTPREILRQTLEGSTQDIRMEHRDRVVDDISQETRNGRESPQTLMTREGEHTNNARILSSRREVLENNRSNHTLRHSRTTGCVDTAENQMETDISGPLISAQEWDRIKRSCIVGYSELALETQISMSLKKFHEMYIADNAAYSMAWFQRQVIKDENVQCSLWTKEDKAVTTCVSNDMKRKITSLHKRTAKVGPSNVPLERRQQCKITSRGVVLNTTLTMRNIPYGENFVVEDVWIAEAIQSEHQPSCSAEAKLGESIAPQNASTQINLIVRYRVKFTKPTMSMVKKVIIDQSKREVKIWFDQYLEMLDSKTPIISEAQISIDDEQHILARHNVVERTLSNPFGNLLSNAYIITFVLFCSLAIFMLLVFVQNVELKTKMAVLENLLHDLHLENTKIIEKIEKLNFATDTCGGEE